MLNNKGFTLEEVGIWIFLYYLGRSPRKILRREV